MPTPIIFTITTAGRLAALDAFDNGLAIALSHCAFGSGKYTPTGSETALNTELGRVALSGGAIESVSTTLRFRAALVASTHIDAFEMGLFSSTGVLFAVASTTSTTIPLTVVDPNIETICAFGLVLGDVPASSLTITLDPNAPLAVQLVTQHEAAAHPHPQYKRRLDNTERMKVAAAVDGDEAIRKDTLDALRVRLIANGIDADLSATNHLPNINVDAFLIPEGYFDSSTLGDKPFAYGICRTRKEHNGVVYQFAQSSTNGDFATRMYRESIGYWTDWKYYANINGSTAEFFNVKTATSDNHAPTYKQLVDGLNALAGTIPSISGKADLAGNSTQIFSAADGASGKQVVNRDQLDTKAAKAGDNTQVFKAAAAAANEDVVRLDQLTSMGGAIKIAILQMIYQVGQPYFNKTDARNPNTIFGVTVGTWVQEKGRFLVGFDDTQEEFDLLTDTGGAKSHTMTLGNLIEHDHDRNVNGLEESVNADSSGTIAGNYSPGANYLKLYTKTGKTGQASPDAIPTLPPYVVYSWWVRTA